MEGGASAFHDAEVERSEDEKSASLYPLDSALRPLNLNSSAAPPAQHIIAWLKRLAASLDSYYWTLENFSEVLEGNLKSEDTKAFLFSQDWSNLLPALTDFITMVLSLSFFLSLFFL